MLPSFLLLFPAMHNWEKSAGFYSLPPFSLPFLFSAASVSSEIVGDRETGEGGGTGVPEVVAAAAAVLLGVGIGGALQRKGMERGGKGRRRSGMREGGVFLLFYSTSKVREGLLTFAPFHLHFSPPSSSSTLLKLGNREGGKLQRRSNSSSYVHSPCALLTALLFLLLLLGLTVLYFPASWRYYIAPGSFLIRSRSA